MCLQVMVVPYRSVVVAGAKGTWGRASSLNSPRFLGVTSNNLSNISAVVEAACPS